MDHQAEFRRCMIDLDVDQGRKLWAHVNPHLPQPKSDREMLIVLHHARTQAQSVPFNKRAYSHQWLTNEGYPSGLPDDLRPKAERIYPVVKSAVGISVNYRSPELKPLAVVVQRAMETAVLEAIDDKITNPLAVRASMARARKETLRNLVGRL